TAAALRAAHPGRACMLLTGAYSDCPRAGGRVHSRPVKTQSFATPPEGRDMPAYDQDFHAWTQRTAALLRAGRFEETDIEHVAEEIEDMGRRDARELNSRMRVLVTHLLKWQFQPGQRSPAWLATLSAGRQEVRSLLEQRPSLRPQGESGPPDGHPPGGKA